jgi:tetratricopeptide (TPR) repeat protein
MAFITQDIERYRRDVDQDPASIKFVPLADALRRAGDLDGAERVLVGGLAHHPSLRSAQVVQARLWRDLGRPTKALALVSTLYPQDAGNVSLTELYCELLLQMGHLDKASDLLEQARFVGFPSAKIARLTAEVERARASTSGLDEVIDLSSLSGVMTLPGLFMEEIGDPFAIPVVAARVSRSGRRTAAKAIWTEVARLHPEQNARANREISRLSGIAGCLPRAIPPSILPPSPDAAAASIRVWAKHLGLDV